MLVYEANRRPKLAAMLQSILNHSPEDIENSGFPKWIRQALLGKIGQAAQAVVDVKNYDNIVDGVMPDPLGELRRWMGGDTFIRIDRGQSLQINSGALVWLPYTGGVWIETVFSRLIDPRLTTAQPAGLINKSGYTTAYKALIAHLVDAPITGGGSANHPLAAYGVRFS